MGSAETFPTFWWGGEMAEPDLAAFSEVPAIYIVKTLFML